jgi:predicted phosphodiesterase
MTLGNRVAIISDVHGEHRQLRQVLEHCERDLVESIVLLGDLFDRLDHAEACVRALSGWRVTGVLGNHEREALVQARTALHELNGSLGSLLEHMGERLIIDEAMFVHDEFGWKPNGQAKTQTHGAGVWVTFAGHTHFRSARDDNGPIDLTMGRVELKSRRRYLINPGAVLEGQFAIWDRAEAIVRFHRV